MKYLFLDISDQNQAKNKAEEEFRSWVHEFSNIVIAEDQYDKLITIFEKRVHQINRHFNRCGNIPTQLNDYNETGFASYFYCDKYHVSFRIVNQENFPHRAKEIQSRPSGCNTQLVLFPMI